MSTVSKYPKLTHEQCCQNLAAMICGIPAKGGPITPAELWPKFSDAFQKDISDFVTKWPPGQSKQRGMYRELPKAKIHSDETEVTPI